MKGHRMPITASDLVPRLARITGLPEATITGVKRRLTETATIPSRRGAIVPKLRTEHVVLIVLGVLADVPAKDVACAAQSYFALTDRYGNKLGNQLTGMIDSFKSANAIAALTYKSRLEIDCNRPRALLSMECIDGQEEVIYGLQSKLWEDITVRRSMTISGKCLFDLAMDIHFNRWNDEND
jgi:hypothetical protein